MKIKIFCFAAAMLVIAFGIGSGYLSHWLTIKLFHDKNRIDVQP